MTPLFRVCKRYLLLSPSNRIEMETVDPVNKYCTYEECDLLMRRLSKNRQDFTSYYIEPKNERFLGRKIYGNEN